MIYGIHGAGFLGCDFSVGPHSALGLDAKILVAGVSRGRVRCRMVLMWWRYPALRLVECGLISAKPHSTLNSR